MIAKPSRECGFGIFLVGVLFFFLSSACGLLEEDVDSAESNGPVESTGWATSVVEVVYGEDASFGQGLMPDVVLGPPSGAGTMSGSLDVLTLGLGGTITLGFGQNACILDLEGDDLTVLENVFFVAGDGSDRFIETARVAVSQDGEEFYTFPTSVDDELPLGDPDRYQGFAGVEAVMPGDQPDEVGGDRFDLAEVGLEWVRYVRVTDTNQDPWDPGDEFGIGFGKAGFDLEAIGAIHLGRGGDCQ
jgi:hypothetical protein